MREEASGAADRQIEEDRQNLLAECAAGTLAK